MAIVDTSKTRSEYDKQYHEEHKERRKSQRARRYELNRAPILEKRLRRHGITPDQYELLLKKQQNACAVCGASATSNRRLDIDHDHRCCSGQWSCGKCIRGLLCVSCNARTVPVIEDRLLVEKAEAYLLAGYMDFEDLS